MENAVRMLYESNHACYEFNFPLKTNDFVGYGWTNEVIRDFHELSRFFTIYSSMGSLTTLIKCVPIWNCHIMRSSTLNFYSCKFI